MTVLKDFVSLVHDKHFKFFEADDFSFEQIEYAADSADNYIATFFLDSLEIKFDLTSTDHVAHAEYFRDNVLKLLYHFVYLDR